MRVFAAEDIDDDNDACGIAEAGGESLRSSMILATSGTAAFVWVSRGFDAMLRIKSTEMVGLPLSGNIQRKIFPTGGELTCRGESILEVGKEVVDRSNAKIAGVCNFEPRNATKS